jgi:hypothetical protein
MSEPSKYDGFARKLLVGLEAEMAMVIVLGGALGHGCARAEQAAEPDVLERRRHVLVTVLRLLADDIERGITEPDQPAHRRGSA